MHGDKLAYAPVSAQRAQVRRESGGMSVDAQDGAVEEHQRAPRRMNLLTRQQQQRLHAQRVRQPPQRLLLEGPIVYPRNTYIRFDTRLEASL